jgi:hypothetical protein
MFATAFSGVDAVTIMLKEYETLRAEVLATLGHRLQVWSFGAAAIAVLVAGALTAVAENTGDSAIHICAGIVMAIVVPLLSLAVLHTWLAEVRRGRRASWYLWGIERRLNESLGVRALGWEEDLRRADYPQMHLSRSYHASTVAFFAVTGAGSLAVGSALLLHIRDPLPEGVPWAPAASLALLFLALCAQWLVDHAQACSRCERDVCETWPDAKQPVAVRGREAGLPMAGAS